MADVFVSYSKEDRARAKVIAMALEQSGWSVWWDPQVPIGSTWDEVLEEEMANARSVVVLWSPASVASGWVKNEAREAKKRRILIPALIKQAKLPMEFSHIQTADLTAWKPGQRSVEFEKLLAGLRRVLVPKAGQLPDDLKELALRNGLDVRPASFHNDMDKVVRGLRGRAPQQQPGRRRKLPKQPSGGGTRPHQRTKAGAAKGRIHVDARINPGWFLPGNGKVEWFQDHKSGPEMVVVPAGSFMMGSPNGDDDAYPDEMPQHLVVIDYRIAIGRYPVTFDEYDAFCRATNRTPPFDKQWGRGRRPVINVSWDDGQAYARWLSGETGKTYRLPSEAEWEYACRAGTTTRYWCGPTISTNDANFARATGKTTVVGSYPANPWGLYDMHGNVWEWVADVWHGNYQGAPANGDAWTTGGVQHVGRGGSWRTSLRHTRSANRNWSAAGQNRMLEAGFRIARLAD